MAMLKRFFFRPPAVTSAGRGSPAPVPGLMLVMVRAMLVSSSALCRRPQALEVAGEQNRDRARIFHFFLRRGIGIEQPVDLLRGSHLHVRIAELVPASPLGIPANCLGLAQSGQLERLAVLVQAVTPESC